MTSSSRCRPVAFLLCVAPALVLVSIVACGGGEPSGDGSGHGGGPAGRGGGPGGRGGPPGAAFASSGGGPATAVPVEVSEVVRRDIADYIETNGTLEAENDVQIVARINGPIVELNVEEGMQVKKGDVLARIDADEILAQLGIAKVAVEEARLALDRARVSLDNRIISQELFDQAQSRYDSASAQLKGSEILLGYTEITAPFDGQIIERYIKFAEHVTTNQVLFRLADFDPLLLPIQIPEKDLRKLRQGQRAYVTVEAYPGDRFPARVLRIQPVVSASTGTVKVTLEAQAWGKLTPGMFASVFLETDVHQDALVMPKAALVLESIGDTVYVMADGLAQRREVDLGFEEADAVEVLSGVTEGERLIVVGQDGLSDSTPVYVLSEEAPPAAPRIAAQDGWSGATGGKPGTEVAERAQRGERKWQEGGGEAPGRAAPAAPGQAPPGRPGGGPPGDGRGFDPADLTPERIERIKERMRQFGLSDEQIAERIEQMKNGTFVPQRGGPGGPGGPPGAGGGGRPGTRPDAR